MALFSYLDVTISVTVNIDITHAARTRAMEFNKIANYYPGEEYSDLLFSPRRGGRKDGEKVERSAKGISTEISERSEIYQTRKTLLARVTSNPPRRSHNARLLKCDIPTVFYCSPSILVQYDFCNTDEWFRFREFLHRDASLADINDALIDTDAASTCLAISLVPLNLGTLASHVTLKED